MENQVSIILPAYNAEKYVAASVESLLAQTCEDFELLIMNDGSTDATAKVLETFHDDRIKVFRQEHAGLIPALNALLAKARGKYIARADADDIYLPNRLQVQVQYLDKHPEIGLVGGFFEKMDPTSGVNETVQYPVTHEEIVRRLRSVAPVAHPIVMFREHLLREINGYDESTNLMQDYDLWIRLAGRTRLANIPKVLFQYRLHTSSVTGSHRPKMVVEHRDVRSKYWSTVPREPQDENEWLGNVHQVLEQEKQQLKQAGQSVEVFERELLYHRIFEANLAYKAVRPDIGMRCLFEVGIISKNVIWRVLYRAAKVFGFRNTWAFFRLAAFPMFHRSRKKNPLFEW